MFLRNIRWPAIFFIMISIAIPCHADVVMDGSMGTSGAVIGPNYDILATYGRQTDINLFHSFQTFDIEANAVATFTGPAGIQNIISRITGGTPSQIDGTLRSGILSADLYLLNPSGILFGPNAVLDLTGSFHAATADYLRMADNSQFYVISQGGDLFTSASPVAFGFLNENPASVTVDRSIIQITDGKTLSLFGGEVNINGGDISVPEGTVQLAAVKSAGEIVPGLDTLDVSSFSSFGTILIDNGTLISVSGAGSGNVIIRGGSFYHDYSSIEADTTGNKPGGTIDIQADNISMTYGSIYSDAQSSGAGGSINISSIDNTPANTITLYGTDIFADTSGDVPDAGDAGHIRISAQAMSVSAYSIISTDSYGPGNCGSLTLLVDELDISGSNIFTVSEGEFADAGNGGAILIETRRLSLSDDSIISSDTYYGGGQGGGITITGPGSAYADSIQVNDSSIYSGAVWGADQNSGDGGTVLLEANSISFANGGKIGSESFGGGDGGDVTLLADGGIGFFGTNAYGDPSRIYTNALSDAAYAGNAGNIYIEADSLSCNNGGGIMASSEGPGQGGNIQINIVKTVACSGFNSFAQGLETDSSGIFARADGLGGNAGDAGNIDITASRLALSHTGRVSTSTVGYGNAGSILLNVGSVDLAPGTSVASAGESQTLGGNAGSVSVTGNQLFMQGSTITTSTSGGGHAGNIDVSMSDVKLTQSAVIASTSESTGAGGNAGTVSVSGYSIGLSDAGRISTSTQGAGNAGAINLSARKISIDTGASVSSSSNFSGYGGDAGTITIQTGFSPDDALVVSNSGYVSTSTAGMGHAGDILILTPTLALDSNGEIASTSNSTGNGGDAGNITISGLYGMAQRITLTDSSAVTTSTYGRGTAGNIDLNAQVIEIDTTSSLSSESTARTNAGDAGFIQINTGTEPADTLVLNNGGTISTSAAGDGQAGDIEVAALTVVLNPDTSISSSGKHADAGTITINALDRACTSVTLTENSAISTSSFGLGNAGAIQIETTRLTVTNAEISSASNSTGTGGNAGTISIAGRPAPSDRILLTDGGAITTATFGSGDAGDIQIGVRQLEVDEGAMISSASHSTGNGGDAGIITINAVTSASQTILLGNESAITTASAGSGTAGDITLEVDTLEVNTNSEISSAGTHARAGTIHISGYEAAGQIVTLASGGTINTSTQGRGNAGSIRIDTQRLAMDGESEVSSSSNSSQYGDNDGNAGAILISGYNNAVQEITITGASAITTSSQGKGKGGNIALETRVLDLDQASSIQADGTDNVAGTVTVNGKNQSTETVRIDNGSHISTASAGVGHAGAIDLDTTDLGLDGSSIISSSSLNPGESGNAGSITVHAGVSATDTINLTTASAITTSNQGTGKGGDIILDVTELDLNAESSIQGTGTHGNAGTVIIKAATLPSETIELDNDSYISTASKGLGDAGAIQMDVMQLEINNGSYVSSSSDSRGPGGAGGKIIVKAMDAATEAIVMQNTGIISTSTQGLGNAGAIELYVKQMQLDSAASVSSSSNAPGQGGDGGSIQIRGLRDASEQIVLQNAASISTQTEGSGDAGEIHLETARLELDSGANISSAAAASGQDGNAGSIWVNDTYGENAVIDLRSASAVTTSSRGSGRGGNIRLAAKTLQMESGAMVSATGNNGNAGSITIETADAVTLVGNATAISTESQGAGNAGAITLGTNTVSLDTGATITSASTLEGPGGDAGTIDIIAHDSIELRNQSTKISTESAGQGDAGDITLKTGRLILDEAAAISSASTSQGIAGNAGTIKIYIDDSLYLTRQGAINTEAINAGGGRVIIDIANDIKLTDSRITTSVKLGAGNGGDIDIDSKLNLLNRSQIIANAYEGQGGNIHIIADIFLASADSAVSASSELGIDGTIFIEAPNADIGSNLVMLPSDFLDAAQWVARRCREQSGEDIGRFVVRGRDGVPTALDDWQPSP